MERTQRELERADVVLAVFEAGQAPPPSEGLPAGRAAHRRLQQARSRASAFSRHRGERCRGVGKDRAGTRSSYAQAILRAAGWSATGESVFLARERHLRALRAARRHFDAAAREAAPLGALCRGVAPGARALASITGEFSADDLLGRDLRRFCIGK